MSLTKLPTDILIEICSKLDSKTLWKLKSTNKEFNGLVKSHKPLKACKYCGSKCSSGTSNESKYCYMIGCMTNEFHPEYDAQCSTFCSVYKKKPSI